MAGPASGTVRRWDGSVLQSNVRGRSKQLEIRRLRKIYKQIEDAEALSEALRRARRCQIQSSYVQDVVLRL